MQNVDSEWLAARIWESETVGVMLHRHISCDCLHSSLWQTKLLICILYWWIVLFNILQKCVLLTATREKNAVFIIINTHSCTAPSNGNSHSNKQTVNLILYAILAESNKRTAQKKELRLNQKKRNGCIPLWLSIYLSFEVCTKGSEFAYLSFSIFPRFLCSEQSLKFNLPKTLLTTSQLCSISWSQRFTLANDSPFVTSYTIITPCVPL